MSFYRGVLQACPDRAERDDSFSTAYPTGNRDSGRDHDMRPGPDTASGRPVSSVADGCASALVMVVCGSPTRWRARDSWMPGYGSVVHVSSRVRTDEDFEQSHDLYAAILEDDELRAAKKSIGSASTEPGHMLTLKIELTSGG